MRKLLSIILVFTCLSTQANTYYVSATGSDSNNGTSTGTAWKTTAKVTASSFSAGDNILFNRGDVFYGSLTIHNSGASGNPITIGAYGTGANPVINGGDNNISTNDKSYIVIRDLELKSTGTTAFAGSLNIGTNSVVGIEIRNCKIDGNRGNGISVNGATVTSIIIDSCDIYNNGDFGILFSNTTAFTSGQISNCNIYGNGTLSNSDAEYISNIQGNIGNLNIFNNQIYNAAPGVALGTGECHGIYISTPTTSPANIYSNTIFGNTNGAGIKARYSANIHDNTIYSNRLEGVELGGNNSTDATYNVYKNVFYGSTTGFPGVSEITKGTGAIYLNLFNNTFYKNGSIYSTTKELSIADDLDSLSIKNNIFYGADNHGGISITVTQTGVVSIDYNNYYQVGAVFSNRYNGNNYSTLLSWQGLGFDTHGIAANPLLASPVTNFRIQPTSPCKNAGVNVGLPFPGIAPNMGAFDDSAIIPTITWANQTIAYGTTLSTSNVYSATASVAGTFSYNISGQPNAGIYSNFTVTFTPDDLITYAVTTKTVTLAVTQFLATITVTNTTQTWTGLPLAPTVTTVPAGLPYSILYNGIGATPIEPNSYSYIANITSPNYYTASPATGTYIINKALATFNISNTSPYFNNTAQVPFVTTNPANLTGVNIASPHTAVGIYSDTITLNNAHYQATQVITPFTITAAGANIVITSYQNKFYTGSPISVIAVTNPAGLTNTVTYNGSSSAPTVAGTYQVIGTITQVGYSGADTVTMVVQKATPILSWNPIANISDQTPISGTQLNATSNVAGYFTYSYNIGQVLGAGVYNITATFHPTDSANYNAATITNTIIVYPSLHIDFFIKHGKFYPVNLPNQ